ncbi:MAG: hypothetical protein RLZZ299_2771 [Pseudomonadota bacterium]
MTLPLLLVTLARAADRCAAWDAPAETALRLRDVEETSGIALGRGARTLYALEDSGHEAVLQVIDLGSGNRGTQRVRGATNTDWEDLAAGPCPPEVDAGRCLWIADTGDNDGRREAVTLWAVAETTDATVDAAACPRTFPEDDARDVEALLVAPDGTLRLVSKENDGQAHVYATDARCDGSTMELFEEATIEVPGPVTGGAVDASGTVFALRTATHALLWYGCTPDWTHAPVRVGLGEEDQGEAIAFDDDGSLWTASEGGSLRPWRSACARLEPTEPCPDAAAACGCDASVGPYGAAPGLLLALALRVMRRRGRAG